MFGNQNEKQTGTDVNEEDLEIILRILLMPLVGCGSYYQDMKQGKKRIWGYSKKDYLGSEQKACLIVI